MMSLPVRPMDFGTSETVRAEAERRYDLSDAALGTSTFHSHQDCGTQEIHKTKLVTQCALSSVPPVQSSPHKIPLPHVSCSSGSSPSVLHSSVEDPTCRKRQRTSIGPVCCPVPARRMNAPQRETLSSSEYDGRTTSRTKSSVLQMVRGEQREHCSVTIPGSRVTALYAELVRELEGQVAELNEILAARDDAAVLREQKIHELEKENQELRRQVQNLEEQNDVLSHCGQGITREVVNKSNITFLKSLIEFLETNSNSQISDSHKVSTPLSSAEPKFSSTEVLASPVLPARPEMILPSSTAADVSGPAPDSMLRVSGVTSGFQYWTNMEEGGESMLPESCALWEEPLQETLPDGSPAWASPLESNGRPKLELVPNSGVYITYQQLEDLSQIPPDKPKLMTRRLLDYFFSRETLARSSATGQRIAHNNTTMEKPLRLPVSVVTAIKAYVTRACGRGCNFNAVINSKCGTSRRAVKKMSIRIDWTEGGGQRCPRTVPGTELAISP
ncbi:uncharacterized protein LOC128644897 isoform X2 [Bombina bombina]|uniref:uncharacterized protein LOC128644897 isoform X2 n=1 Tax=Bombina bombina TaxID=8345 RepID=UPI00235B2CBB|nr:uncharacterized protein LOC128644897 isoform X2 [Bombina bombina]